MWHDTQRTPLWRNVSFTLMWVSTAASGFGDRVMMLAALTIMGAAGADAESTSINAATQFAFFFAYFIFSLPGGWLADHLPRKWIMLGCDEMRALTLLFAMTLVPPTIVALGPEAADWTMLDVLSRYWQVLAVLFIVGTFAACFNPARTSVVPQVVPPTQLQAGNAILISISVVANMVGLVVASYIMRPDDTGTIKNGLILAVILFAISGTFFAFMRVHEPIHVERRKKRKRAQRDDPEAAAEPPPPDKRRTFVQALRYILAHKRIIQLTLLHCLTWGAAMIVYSAPFAVWKVNFGITDQTELLRNYAWLSAMLGLGMLAGAAVVAWIRTRKEATLPMMVALIFAGLSVTLLAIVRVESIVYLLSFMIGLFGNITIIGVITLLQSITPNYIRGRVIGLDALATTIVSLCVLAAVTFMPNADYNILWVLDVIGPLMMLVGGFQLMRFLLTGPMPNRMANLFWKLERWFCLVWHRLEWHGRHHIPHEGPVVIASNHTTALDPFLIQAASPRMVRWLMLESYRFGFLNPLWNAIDPICLPHRIGDEAAGDGTAQVRQIVKELKKGDVAGIFPEGHLQYDDRVLKEFEPGAAVCARLSGAVIVPCWVSGTPRSRKMLVHWFKPTKSRVHFGPPMTVDRKADPEKVTAELRERMLELKAEQERRDAKKPRHQEALGGPAEAASSS
ncbi:MAG: MFS transporter [Planctomycetota bacterium]